MKTTMLKIITKKVVVLNVLATLSLSTAFAQSNELQFPNSNVLKINKDGSKGISKEESSFYFDPTQLNSNYASWGVNPDNSASINLLNAWKKFYKHKDAIVAVVDTGIDPNHPFLEKNIYVRNGLSSKENYGVDFSKGKADPKTPLDVHGHGTHVSGIIKSIFPEVKILALKYYNVHASGYDNLNSTIEALRYAVNSNVDVINYSGGGPESSAEELSILKEAERKGILVVAAAGNNESNIDEKRKAYYPASYGLKNIITVTAHDENLNILNSSNYGKDSVDIFAPGYRIKSSIQNGRSGYQTGTSQATAFVTGVAALLKSKYPNLSAEKIKEIIKSSVKREASMIGKCSTGGRLDAAAAIAKADELNEIPARQLAHDQSAPQAKQEGKIIYRLAN